MPVQCFVFPSSQTTHDDFGLSCPEMNRSQAMRLLAAPHKVLHEDGIVLLGSALNSGVGEIFLCRKDEFSLTYYLRYEVKQIEPLGIAATKVALWRQAAPGLKGGTSGIPYTLLVEYDAIVGDDAQTYDGRRYWLDRMAEAWEGGVTVGVMDGDRLVAYDGKIDLLSWVQAMYDRGNSVEAEPMCFFIARATKSADRF
jgi:hypothetical protein